MILIFEPLALEAWTALILVLMHHKLTRNLNEIPCPVKCSLIRLCISISNGIHVSHLNCPYPYSPLMVPQSHKFTISLRPRRTISGNEFCTVTAHMIYKKFLKNFFVLFKFCSELEFGKILDPIVLLFLDMQVQLAT